MLNEIRKKKINVSSRRYPLAQAKPNDWNSKNINSDVSYILRGLLPFA